MSDSVPGIGIDRHGLFFLVWTVVLLAASLWQPIAMTVVPLMFLGVLHFTLELRYVFGRFRPIMKSPFIWWLLGMTTLVMVARGLSGILSFSRSLEIIAGVGVLMVGCVFAFRGVARIIAVSVAIVLLILSLLHPSTYFFVLTHLHNLVPLAFLIDWSRTLARRPQIWFIAINVVWVVLVPIIIIGFLQPDPNLPDWLAAIVGDGQNQLRASSPPGVTGDLAWRYQATFAFQQGMHYVVWIGFFTWAAPKAVASFNDWIPELRGWRVWGVGMLITAVVLVGYAIDYSIGYSVYSLLTSYHVYIEFPLLIVLMVGVMQPKGGVTQ